MSGATDDEEFERIVAGLDLSVPDLDVDPPEGPQPSTDDQADSDDLLATHGTFQPSWSDTLPEDEEDEDDGDEFVPPDPGPLPRGDRWTRLAWRTLIGGPALLFLLAILDAPVPGIVPGTVVVAFVVALIMLLVQRGDNDRGDDPDHGAVI